MELTDMVVNMDDVPGAVTPGGTTLKVPVHPEVTGTPKTAPLSLLLVILPPGTSTTLHIHKTSDEYEYILCGTGVLQTGDKKDIPVGKDMVVINLIGVLHEVKNTGKDTMMLLRVHTPPLEPWQPGDAIEKAISEAKKAFDATTRTFKSS